MKVDWTTIKDFTDNQKAVMRYVETSSNYYLIAADAYFKLECELDKVVDTTDISDFETNYKANANQKTVDVSGRSLVRQASTVEGWTYLAPFMEITLGAATSVYFKDYKGNNRYTTTIKHYDAAFGGNVVAPASYLTSALRTEITVRGIPDYDIISGAIFNNALATPNVRVYMVIGVINPSTEVEVSTKEMVGGCNLKYFNGIYNFDGRSSKYMQQDLGLGMDANQVRIIMQHDLAAAHNFMIEFEYYRA